MTLTSKLLLPKPEIINLYFQTQVCSSKISIGPYICCCCQSPRSVSLFVIPWTVAHHAFLIIIISWRLPKFIFVESVMPSKYLILFCPLLLLPAIFPSIRVFSSESAVHIRWPKYWSFSFSISPSKEYSEFISFKIDWIHLPAIQGTLKSLLQYHSSKASILWHWPHIRWYFIAQ